MRPRIRLTLLAAGALLTLPGPATVRADPPTARLPNVVLILADDLGYGDLGCYGATQQQTPHLDRLAREGARLTQYYTAQAVCSASRAALLTGCYPNRVGILGALGPKATHGIHTDETTLAEVLHARGYATAIFGKWHLGHRAPFLPTRHGFDEYFGLPYSNDMWPHHPERSDFPPLPLYDGEAIVEIDPPQSQFTVRYTQRAVEFIHAQASKPFFLYLPHTMPHVPLGVSAQFAGKSAVSRYGDVIEELDWSVGQLLEALAAEQVLDETVVVFTSDNGPWLSYGNHAGQTGGLREGKGTTFEGGIRVPCLVRYPPQIRPGITCAEPAMSIDWVPTLARLAGGTHGPVDGSDLWPWLMDSAPTTPLHAGLNFYWNGELQAIRDDRWKLHFPHTYRRLAQAGHDGRAGKYVEQQITKALYDLETDPAEERDVLALHPEVVAELEQLAAEARADLGDTLTQVQGKGVRPAGRE